METIRVKQRKPVEDVVEDWDDDDLVIEGDLTFRSSANSTNAPSARRDSHSSHFSFRSDLESMGGEEERHVHLPGDDEKARLDAIATAEKAGIPIPHNVPPSALMGGTIKRLGGRKIQKIIQDDWGDDLEIPDTGQGLHIKTQDSSKFPEVLRQVSSSVHPSPTKSFKSSSPALPQDAMPPPPPKPKTLAAPIDLDKYRDDEDDDDLFGDGSATIRVPKNRQPKPLSLITPPTPQKKGNLVSQPEPERVDGDDDFENDFELPSDGKLKLSTKRDIPKTPSLAASDDFDWGEGSLGTRFGGTRRDGRSNRSSSVSALSPSVSSSITAESEDETFDGLVLPHGLNFSERLKQRRRRSRSPARIVEEPSPQPVLEKVPEAVAETPAAPPAPTSIPEKPMPTETDKDDFFADLDLGDVDVLTFGKLNLHKNVKIKEMRPPSPQRPKTAVSITFTSKPQPQHPASRLPRPMTSHERTLTQSSLEPVSESGGPILSRTRRSQSRLGHSAQSSVSSVQTPTTPSSATSLPPSTPRRRELGQKTSAVSLRNEPTTTSAQLLRLKRSLPAMRQQPSPVRPTTSTYARPPSRTDGRPQSGLRPKTPVDRPRTVESAAAQARRNPVPFLPAGASAAQSHNVNAKVGRPLRRHDSDNVLELRPGSRAISRSTMRSPSPKRYHDVGRLVVDGSWHQLSKPMRPRHFGDGHELDGFDDLPTSAQAESRFIRQPVNASGKNSLRNKIYQNLLPDRMSTPSPSVPQSPYTPYSPARTEYTPHYLRDTAASRIARETSLAQRAPSTGPLAPLTAQRVAQLSTRTNLNPALPQSQLRSKKPLKRPPQLKPHLIANLNPPKESKVVNGMYYNPETLRWEGNDHVLSAFNPPASSPSTASLPPYLLREKENATPRPALIANRGTQGVQVVGGMVFDPVNMCWLKLGPPPNARSDPNDPMDGFNALDDDEDDVFKDIPDLEDNTSTTLANGGDSSDSNAGMSSHGGIGGGRGSGVGTSGGRMSDINDWLVGEEFDVGPEFIRRQREEEERWRKKCERWLGTSSMAAPPRDQEAWRWTIRDLVLDS